MTQYGLGPNGAIMTSLNLFSTKFDQVLSLIEKRSPDHDHVIFDTPGQIEVFTWSASGSIITETLASTIPTVSLFPTTFANRFVFQVILYVMDVAKCTSPVTFMSNMMYACSILYKPELPFVLVLNKSDIVNHAFAIEWMRDYETFLDAINRKIFQKTVRLEKYSQRKRATSQISRDRWVSCSTIFTATWEQLASPLWREWVWLISWRRSLMQEKSTSTTFSRS